MAEPLSIAASIAGLVSLTGSVFGLLCKLSLQQKDFNREITELQTVTIELSVLLHDLSLLATALQAEPTFDGSLRLDHVDSWERTLNDISIKLKKILPEGPPPGRAAKAIKSTKNRLKWPYSSKEFEKLLADLARHKETISLALSVDSVKALLQALSKQRDISDGVNEIRDAVDEIKTRIFVDEHREKVLDFFLPVNPQINFETSTRLRHLLTGLWLIEEQVFKDWIYNPNAKLWMSGIPGAGKTVIAGSVIEEVLAVASHGTAIGACFFFCDYKDPKSLDMVNILSSFASQLARQNDRAYVMLEQYYVDLRPSENLPKPIKLVDIRDVLVRMSELFDRVLVVVDGVDECGTDSPVVDELAEMSHKSQVISMALLSRNEIHIREALGGFDHIDIAAQGSDVRRYVREELEDRINRRQIRLRSQELKEDIINTLIDKAGGMFRWVSCQLDYLCELPMDKDRREALTKLPPTLNATYERILLRNSHPTAVHIICTTLRLVAALGPSITVPELCDAVSVQEHATCLQEDDVVIEEDILRCCSSLLRISPDRQHLEFAHFSVPEFLQSTSLLGTSLDKYHLGTDNVMAVAELCLRVLLLDNFKLEIPSDSSPEAVIATAKTICEEHPFYGFAAWEWPFLSEGFLRDTSGKDDSPIRDEDTSVSHRALENALSLFTLPGESNFKLWAVTFCERYHQTSPLGYNEGVTRSIPPILEGTFTPFHMACVLTLPSIIPRLADGSILHQSCQRQLLVDCAIYGVSALEYGCCHPVLHIDEMRQVRPDIQTDMLVAMAKSGYIEFPMLVPWIILAQHRPGFRKGRLSDPTAMVLKLLEGGFSCDLSVVIWLEGAIARFCNTQNVDGDGLAHRLRIIRQKINPRGLSDGEMGRINKLFTHMIQSSISGSFTMGYRHPKELTDNTFRQLVYESVQNDNISALEVYSTDARYKPRRWRLTGYTPLLHAAMFNDGFETFGYLASTGWDDSVLDGGRNTVWHMMANGRHCEWFERLRDISADPESRQADVNCNMETPIRVAVRKQNYHLARQLLGLCKSRECFVGSPSICEMALRGGDGATQLIEALFLHGALCEKDQLPVHQIALDSDPVAVKQLLSLWPGCTDQRYRGRLPIESLLERIPLYNGRSLNRDILLYLLPICLKLQLEVFRFFCLVVLSYNDIPYAGDDFPKVLETVIEVMADVPGVPEPLSSLVKAFLTWIETGTSLPTMTHLDTAMSGILSRSVHRLPGHWRSLVLCELLHASVFFGWGEVSREVLALGVKAHEYVQDRSVLEVACLPGSLCSAATFAELIKVSTADLQHDSKLVFQLAKGKDNKVKLEHLLKRGADPNPEHSISGQRALIYHLHHGSKETTQLLLKYSERSQAHLAGFDFACALVWWNLSQELAEFKERRPHIEWNGEVHPSLYLDYEDSSIPKIHDDCGTDWRLVHLAAFRESFECLAYLHDEGLVPNINTATSAGYTCAHFIGASEKPRAVLCINYLQTGGCNFNSLTKYQQNALDIAIRKKSPMDTVKALASIGVKVSNPDCFKGLVLDDALGVIECISSVRQEDRPEKDWMLYTLRNAIKHGNVVHCERLRSLGCLLDRPLPGCGSCTPLLYALYYEKYATVNWLLNNGSVAWGTTCKIIGREESPISLAAARPVFNGLLGRLLYSLRDSLSIWLLEKASPVIAAIRSLNQIGLRIILEFISGQNNCEDRVPQQMHPIQVLHARMERCADAITDMPHAATVLNTPKVEMALHMAAYKDSPALMALLIEYGARIDARDARGRTPIHVAAKRRSLEAVKFLLDRGADTSCPSPRFWSLLSVAAKLDDLELLKLVAPYCLPDRTSPILAGISSPLSCCRSERCLQFLLAEGFSVTDIDALGLSPIHFLLGRRALQPFIIRSNLLATRGLNQLRVKLEELPDDVLGGIVKFIPQLVRTLGKETALAMFPPRPNIGTSALCVVAEFDSVKCCRELVSLGADIDFDGHPDGSALAVAISCSSFKVVKYLVNSGASMVYYSRRESCWKSAFVQAHRHPRICRWLLVDRYTEQRRITFD